MAPVIMAQANEPFAKEIAIRNVQYLAHLGLPVHMKIVLERLVTVRQDVNE
jgi:hypothetical protein